MRWPPVAVWLICLLPILLQLPVLLGRFDSDPMLFVAAVGEHAHLPGGRPWIDPNVGYQSQALGKLSADLLLHGQMPWWNPYNGVGLPLAAEAQPGSLFLPFVLLYHFRTGIIWVELLLQVLAGICTYALFRKLRMTELAAVVGGVLYEFNGTFAWHGAPVIGPIAFLPMLLLGVEQLFHRMQEGRPGGWILIPVALAWSLYSGFPETAYINGLLVALWVVFRLPDMDSSIRLRFIGKLALLVGVGLACSLPQVVPFAEYVSNAYVGGHAGYFAHIAMPWAMTAPTLVPGLFGPIFRFNDPSNLIGAIWGDIGGYFPALQLALVLLTIQLRPRRLVLVCAIWIVLCVAKTYDVRPLSDLVNLLPLIKSAALYRYSSPSSQFAGVFVICAGINAIQRGAIVRYRHIAIAFVTTAVCVLLALWLSREPIASLWGNAVSARFVTIAVIWTAVALLCGVACAVSIRHGYKALPWLVGVLLLDAVATFAWPMQSGASQIGREHPGVAFLRSHIGLQRVYSLGPMAANYGAYFKVAQINHEYLPVSATWIEYVRQRLDPAASELSFKVDTRRKGYGPVGGLLSDRLAEYEEVGVKYVLAQPGINPYAQVVAVPSDARAYHAPLALDGGGAVLHWTLPAQDQARSVSEISVLIANYIGLSDGVLNVEICLADGSCVKGHRAISESVDNMPFTVVLDRALPIAAVPMPVQLMITFTQSQSTHPLALWISGVEASHADEFALEGSPGGTAPSVSLVFADHAMGDGAVATHRKVYDGPDMSIYELPGAKPYFEVTRGDCTVRALTREHAQVQCATPAVLLRREAFYPGWSVAVDGRSGSLEGAHEIFQSVALSAGAHDIVFSYRPTHSGWIWAGFFSGVLVLLVGLVKELAARRHWSQPQGG